MSDRPVCPSCQQRVRVIHCLDGSTALAELLIVEIGDPRTFPDEPTARFFAYPEPCITGPSMLIDAVDCSVTGLGGCGSLYGVRRHECEHAE